MKRQNKKQSLLFALPVLATLVFGSIGTTNAFAEDASINFIPYNVSSVKKETLQDVSPDRQTEVQFRGGTDGWAVIGGHAFVSEIGLQGNAIHQENGVWKVQSEAKISVADRDATLELQGKAVNGKLRLHGTGTLESGDTFRIILRGHYVPLHDNPGDFVLDFSTAKIQNMETGHRIPLSQNGIIHVEPVIPKVDDFADFETNLNLEE